MTTSFSRLAVAAALAAGVAFASPATAQQQGSDRPRQGQEQGRRMDPAQRLERRVQQLTQRLELSSAQAAQVRSILQQEQQQFAQFRGARGEGRAHGQQRGGDDAQRRQGFEQMRAVRERTEQQIERVLNRTQPAEYRQMREQREQRGRDGGRGERGHRGEGRSSR